MVQSANDASFNFHLASQKNCCKEQAHHAADEAA